MRRSTEGIQQSEELINSSRLEKKFNDKIYPLRKFKEQKIFPQ